MKQIRFEKPTYIGLTPEQKAYILWKARNKSSISEFPRELIEKAMNQDVEYQIILEGRN